MKRISIVFAILANSFLLKAQNVGINNTNPGAALDVNGDLILRNSNITLVNGANEDINTTAQKFSHYTITGPTTVFEIGGLNGGTNGRMVTLYNSSAFLMVIKHLSPGSLLINQINTGTGIDYTLSSYSSVTFRYQSVDNHWHIISSHNQWNIGGSASQWSTIGNNIYNNNAGNVGIGINNPAASLSVARGTGIDGTAAFWGANNVSHFNYGVDQNTYIRGGRDDLFYDGRGSDVFINDIPGFNHLDNVPQPGGNVLLVGGGGNVGIRTSNPIAALSFANELGDKISFWNNSPTQHYGIGIQSGTMQFYTAGTDKMSFGYGSSANFIATMNYYPGTAQLGINCLPRPGYHLSVNGLVKAKEIVVELTDWADYVFDKKYKLPTLSEVEKFIELNKHLPGIPSAQEIQTNGLKVGDMQTKMMQKIEELTLYVIEQDKKIEELKKELTQILKK
jgi:hypothetical protein